MSDFLGTNQETRKPYMGPVVAKVLGANLNEEELKALGASDKFAETFGKPNENQLTTEVTLPDGSTTEIEQKTITIYFQPIQEEVNQIFPATIYMADHIRYSKSGSAQYITKQGVTSFPKKDTGDLPEFITTMDSNAREAKMGEGDYYDFLDKALGFNASKAKERDIYLVSWAEKEGFGFNDVINGNIAKLNEALKKFSKGMVVTIGVNPENAQMKIIMKPDATFKNNEEVPESFVIKLRKKINDQEYPLSSTLETSATFQEYSAEDVVADAGEAAADNVPW